MSISVSNFNTASEADQLPPWDRSGYVNLYEYTPSNHERSFSDFDIDGSEKDWLQEAIAGQDGSGLAYNNKDSNSKKTVEDFIDGMEAMAELQEAQKARMDEILDFGNGLQLTRAELDKAKQKIREEIESDREKFAKENGMTLEQLAVYEQMLDYHDKHEASPEELKTKFGEDAYNRFTGTIEKAHDPEIGKDNQVDANWENENTDIEAKSYMNESDVTNENDVASSGWDDFGYQDSPEQPVASFDQAKQSDNIVAGKIDLQSSFEIASTETIDITELTPVEMDNKQEMVISFGV